MKFVPAQKILQVTKSIMKMESACQASQHLPSLPLKIGYALDSVASLVHGYGLRQNDDCIVKDATGFQQLYQHEWSVRISSASLRTLADNKFNRLDILPVTSDLMKLISFCEDAISTLSQQLKKKSTTEVWRQLAETVLTRLTIFNKRRGSEPSSILLKRFEERKNREKFTHGDIMESLSPLEKKLVDRFVYICTALFESG